MNQEQLKAQLLELDGKAENFTVTFSGKTSHKVDGVYYPDNREIIVHNKNFQTDNELVYTGIHEFAHHLHFTRSAKPVTTRAHTVEFWNIFHTLLFKAEEKNIYTNVFKTNDAFKKLTFKIKSEYFAVNGTMMKEFGELLIEAMRLCEEHRASFDDYVDRELGLHRFAAKTIMKTFTYDVNPSIGYENMKTVARINDDSKRMLVEKAFLSNQSPDQIKAKFNTKPVDDKMTKLEYLEKEKDQVMAQLERLSSKLMNINVQIEELHKDGSVKKKKHDEE